MKAKESHNMTSVSWRLRKPSGVIQSESEVLRLKEACDGSANLAEGLRTRVR
jgi:hypothetical protein